MKILFMGGTRFFGVHAVNALVESGHEVTIATRGITSGTLSDKVKRLIFDRNERKSIKAILLANHYDVIYDNICYAPDDVKNVLDFITDEKYIYTSTTAVYEPHHNVVEEDFDPLSYPLKFGKREEFEYAIGKRYCERVAFGCYNKPVTAVRIPIVLGTDDYTKRLYFYIEKILKGIPFYMDNPDEEMSFISSDEAGRFLSFLAEKNYIGAINGASEGTVTFKEIIRRIEKISGKKAIFSRSGEIGAYNGYKTLTINTENAKSLGFSFRNINDYLDETIQGIFKNIT